MISKEIFQNLFPFIFITLLLYSICVWTNIINYKKIIYKIIVLAISGFITFVPLIGLSLADFLNSINANYSIGSLALVLVLFWPKIFEKQLLIKNHLLIFCSWNVAFSLVLFFSALGLIPCDIYALGYHFSPLFLIMAVITIIAVWIWPPLSFILIAYIAAFNLRLLPSSNFFDYITDGFLLLMSLWLLLFLALQSRTSGPPRGYVGGGK